jgi:hypothetical protein
MLENCEDDYFVPLPGPPDKADCELFGGFLILSKYRQFHVSIYDQGRH